ncbi:hypothetical protein MNBD_GAMMA16-1369 [hydrothermal vent metagenome]|uniref:Type II secretion system protein L n=1 Tax=hydrothermal vent metagenome TaxID=652676 RepID=A0A3B0ZVL4_9ZZZZ
MRKRVIIRLHTTGKAAEASWVVLDGTSGEQPVVMKEGSLTELGEVTTGARVVLLAPSEDILLLQADVPSVNQKKILSVVPYALEEQLIDDVDNQHFATGNRNDAGLLNTAVVEHELIKDWLIQLRAVGIQIDIVIPDVLATPHADGQWTLFLEDHHAMLRTGPQSGLAMDASNASLLYESTLRLAKASPPEKVIVYDFRTVPDDQSKLWLPQTDSSEGEQLEIEIVQPNEPAIGLLAESLDERQAIDLLQGEYSHREKIDKLWRPWRLAAGLLVGLLALQLLQGLIVKSQLKNELSHLQEQVKERYMQTFPDAKRVVNARVQMASKLKALRGGDNSEQGAFLALLEQVSKPLSEANGVELTRFSYRVGKLNVTLKINNLQQLDQLKQNLAANGDLVVDIQSASSKRGKVEARLQIEQGDV